MNGAISQIDSKIFVNELYIFIFMEKKLHMVPL